jgi:hypothetical protein
MGNRVRNWDLVVFVILVGIHIAAWSEFRTPAPIPDALEWRQFGATTMGGTATAGLTAVSILIPASLLVIQLARGPAGSPLPTSALSEIFRGTTWLLGSMVLGLFVIYLLPMRSQSYDVSRDPVIGLLYFPQLLALFLGILRIALGLRQTINP